MSAEGVDYSVARPSPAALVAAGKTFVGRYVVGPLTNNAGGRNGKLLTADEAKSLHDVGLSIFLFVEYASGSALGGFSTGVNHANAAVAQLAVIGAPADSVLYPAVDFDCTPSQWPVVRAYLQGFASVVGLARTGVYGGIRTMQWAARDKVATWFFQTYAWSAGQWFSGCHVRQYHNGVTVAGGDVDLCLAVQDNFGQWEADAMTPDEAKQLAAAGARAQAAMNNDPFVVTSWSDISPTGKQENKTHTALVALQTQLDALKAEIGDGNNGDLPAHTHSLSASGTVTVSGTSGPAVATPPPAPAPAGN